MFKKILVLILCTSINLHGNGQPTPTTQTPTKTNPGHTESSYAGWLLKPALVTALITLHLALAPEPVQQNFLRQISSGPALARNFITQYLSWSTSTLAHEGGHALARKMLTGTDSAIHFGADNANATSLLTIGPISIDGINPQYGHTHATTDTLFATFLANYRANNNLGQEPLSPQQITQLLTSDEFLAAKQAVLTSTSSLLITASGGLSSLFIHHLIQKITTGQLTFDAITANQLFNLLLPLNPNSDAAILWRHGAGFPDSVITQVCDLAFLVDIAMEVYLAIKETTDPTVTPLYSQVLIGLINRLTRGYLRFQA